LIGQVALEFDLEIEKLPTKKIARKMFEKWQQAENEETRQVIIGQTVAYLHLNLSLLKKLKSSA
jgi:hypothetical protein